MTRTGLDNGDRLRRLVTWLRRTRGHGIWIATWTVVGVAGTVAAPVLIHRPVLLMAMSPRTVFVALAARHLDLAAFVAIGTARLSVSDASYFIVGGRVQRSGCPSSRPLLRSAQRSIRSLCASPPLAGLVLFLRPSGRYLAVAGAHRVSAPLAAVTSVTGTVVYLIAIHQGLGLMLT